MQKIIIFDFNRTLYDPENDRLVRGARHVLRTLRRRGFALMLISRAGPSRSQRIASLGLGRYFSRVIVSPKKRAEDFARLVAPRTIARSASFVVGDRVRKEIRIGNALGMQTVWVRSGPFAGERPRSRRERPTRAVRALRDVLSVIH